MRVAGGVLSGGLPAACEYLAGRRFDASNAADTFWGMVVASPDKEWLTVAEAAQAAGCTQGWIRLLLGRGDLAGWKAGERAWLVDAAAARALRGSLSTRSVGQREAQKPASKRRKSR